jgi:heme exporter protein D
MKTWVAVGVALLGLVVLLAGGVAMYNHAIIADETGISGWNPALWIVIAAGLAVAVLGLFQTVQAVSEARARATRQESPVPKR